MFLVLMLYALFATVFTISKVGLKHTQPLFFVGTRMLLAGVVLIGYQLLFRRQEKPFNRFHLWKTLRLALFNIYLTNVFEFWGLQYLTSFKTCFIYSLSPFLSALFSYFIFSEKLSGKKWIGLAVGIVGLMPILFNESHMESQAGQLLFFSWAEISVMLAATCSVYGWILLRQLINEEGYSPFMANGLSMLLGGAMALGHSYFVENWNPIPVTQSLPFLECTILLIVISNIICYNLYGTLMKKYSATFLSFAGFTTPMFTAFFGWLYLGEVVTWPFYLSAVIVFAGLLLFYQEELQRDYYIATSPAKQIAD